MDFLDGYNYVIKYLRSGLNENLSSENIVQYRFNTCLVLIDNRSGYLKKSGKVKALPSSSNCFSPPRCEDDHR